MDALDGGEAGFAIGRAVFENKNQLGGVGVGGLPADGLGQRAGREAAENEKENENEWEAHGRYQSLPLVFVAGFFSPSMI